MDKAELERELLAQARVEWQRCQKRREKLLKTKSRHQREIEEAVKKANELRRKFMVDPALREVDRKYVERFKTESASKLVCPSCGEGDKGNLMNGKPWCLKCNTALVTKDKILKWQKLPTIRLVKRSLKDDLKNLNPGLNPDGKDEK